MALIGNVSIQVPDLPDAEVWFLNNAAWVNYWGLVPATISINPANTTIYVPVAYDDLLQAAAFNVGGVDYIVATKAMLDSLKTRLNAVEASYQDLRSQLKDAGFITNAQ